MKTAELKVEHWEDEDYIITGLGFEHTGVYSKRDANIILNFLQQAMPKIQLDAFKAGERFAAGLLKGKWDTASQAILTDANNRTELP